MPPRRPGTEPSFQRTALAPGILGAVAAFLGPALLEQSAYTVVLYAISILALIVAVFAGQAKQWRWIPVMVAIAVLWNPVYPFDPSGPWWIGAHIVAGFLFLTVGALVRVPRED